MSLIISDSMTGKTGGGSGNETDFDKVEYQMLSNSQFYA